MKVQLYDGALEIKNGTISSKQSIQVMQYNTGAIKNIPDLSEVRELLTMAYLEGQSIEEEFIIRLELNTSNNLYLSYSKYPGFNLENISEDDYTADFCFRKNDIKRLQTALNLPNEIVCYLYNDIKVDATEALCVLLKRIAYPCRYSDMIPRLVVL